MDAYTAGLNQWNSRSGATGVVFEPAPPGTIADLEFMPDATRSGPCASYTPNTERIFYNPTGFTQSALARPDYAAGIIAHEIGHFLGLEEGGTNPSPPSIMNNPFGLPGDTCNDLNVPTTTVQTTDAQQVPACIGQARQQNAQVNSYTYNEPNYSFTPTCYTYY